MKTVFIILIAFFIQSSSFASGEAETAVDPRFGPGKAIEAFDKEQGFKLSERAAANLGVTFGGLTGAGPWRIPKTSLVQLKQSTGVYRKYDGWISYVLVKVQKIEGNTAIITSEDLEPTDEVATAGAAFLRMTDSDLNAGTVDSCAH